MIDINDLKQFKEYLYENEKSKYTVDGYSTDIKQFFNFYKKNINDINKADIKAYIKSLHIKELSIKTINRKLVSLHQYIEFLNDVQNTKIVVKVKQLKVEQQNFIEDMLDINSVRRIVKAAENENDIKITTALYTLFYTGVRISEMLQVKSKDINKDSVVVLGKGNKYRTVLIPKKLQKQWKVYADSKGKETEYLFNGAKEGHHICRQTVHKNIKKYTGKARGIPLESCHCHAFRHLYAKSLGMLGVNPVVVAQLLGHSLNITGMYMQVSKRELLDTINLLEFRAEDEACVTQ